MKKWKDLKNSLPADRREAIDKRILAELADMPLNKMRKACNLTQEQVAAELGIKQAAVSKLERQTDMHISTLRRFVDAMGGTLELVATFPEGSVIVSSLGAQKR